MADGRHAEGERKEPVRKRKAADATLASRAEPPRSPRRPWLGGSDLVLGVLTLVAIWALLPARYWPMDVFGTTLAVLLLFAGSGLVLGTGWARPVALGVGALALAVGLVLFTGLAFTASWLSGQYGPVGAGGAVLLSVVAALVLPYLVVLPAAQLWALARPAASRPS